MSAVEKIASLANVLKEDDAEDVAAAFMPIFVYIVGRKGDYSVNVKSLLNSKLKNPKFYEAISKVFTAG